MRRTRTTGDRLAIRWFTPRGRELREEVLDDLRHADGEHLPEIVAELRRPGVKDDVLDLRGIDLRGIDLGGACLANSDLTGARLDRANLRNANLSKCNLTQARLAGAALMGANLRSSNLMHADLTGCDLTEADVSDAEVRGCELRGARLRRTWAKGVDFLQAQAAGVDLSRIRVEDYRPAAPTTRRYEIVGAPPHTEPRPTRRFATHRTPRPAPTRFAPTRRLAPLPALRGEVVSAPASESTFEEALAQLLLQKGSVERIEVVIDGSPVVLFQKEAHEGPALRAA